MLNHVTVSFLLHFQLESIFEQESRIMNICSGVHCSIYLCNVHAILGLVLPAAANGNDSGKNKFRSQRKAHTPIYTYIVTCPRDRQRHAGRERESV